MYTEDDIMTYEDFNAIEQRIATTTTNLINLGYSLTSYTPRTWVKKDFLLYTYLNHIEQGIRAIGQAYFRPYGWQNPKSWLGGFSFSYKDVNRWVTDLNLIDERISQESNSLFPSDTLYPSETLLPH